MNRRPSKKACAILPKLMTIAGDDAGINIHIQVILKRHV
jgi:hypothetical protein